MHHRIEGEGRLARLILTDEAEGFEMEWLPFWGGLLNKWVVRDARGQPWSLLEGYSDPDALAALSYSRGIHLSPFPNRIRDGKYSFEGADYQLAINKANEQNAIHGLLQSAAYQLDVQPDGAEMLLKLTCHYDGDAPSYPFAYTYIREYRIQPKSLKATVTVESNCSMNMAIAF
jgi:aldose 1-epimerase